MSERSDDSPRPPPPPLVHGVLLRTNKIHPRARAPRLLLPDFVCSRSMDFRENHNSARTARGDRSGKNDVLPPFGIKRIELLDFRRITGKRFLRDKYLWVVRDAPRWFFSF